MMAVVHQVEQYEGTVEQERFFCLSVCLSPILSNLVTYGHETLY